MRIAMMGVGLLALATLVGGCGGTDPATTDPTVASSTGTNPPESPSPIAATGLPQLVDLGSDSCVPCQMMAPELKAGRIYKDQRVWNQVKKSMIAEGKIPAGMNSAKEVED
jgi:hypothetical protein